MNRLRLALSLALSFSLVALVGCSSSSETSGTSTVTCTAPVTDALSFERPASAWCVPYGRGVAKSTKACDGYVAVVVGDGVDCSTTHLFDETSKAYVAELRTCNIVQTDCLRGPSSFRMPAKSCLEGGFAYGDSTPCPNGDAGVDAPDAPDAPADTSDSGHD